MANKVQNFLSLKSLIFVSKLLVSLFLIILLFRTIDIAEFLGRLTPLLLIGLFFTAFMLLLQAWVCSYRWWFLGHAFEKYPPLLGTFSVYLQGMFFNLGLPSVVGGDSLRVYYWCKTGLSAGKSAGSVLTDRLAGANGAALMAIPFLYFYPSAGELSSVVILIVVLVVFALSLGWIIALRFVNHLPLKAGPLKKIQDTLNDFGASIYRLRFFGVAVVLSIFGHCVTGTAVFFLAKILNLNIGLLFTLGMVATVFVMSMLPISIGGWGLREAMFVHLLQPYVGSTEDAILLGLLLSFATILAGLPGGVLYIFSRSDDFSRTAVSEGS